MSSVTLTGCLRVPPEDLEAVREALPHHVALTRAEPGCVSFRVEEDPHEAGVFRVEEEFLDAEAFAAHQRRVRESSWGSVSAGAVRDYHLEGLGESGG